MSSVQIQSGVANIYATTKRLQTGLARILSNILVQTRKCNFPAFQGATFSINFTVYGDTGESFNLTGWSPIAWMSKSFNGIVVPIIPLNVSVVTPSAGLVNVYIANTDTEDLDAAEYLYNIDIINGSVQLRVLQGFINVYAGING